MPTATTKPFMAFAKKLTRALVTWADRLKSIAPRLSHDPATAAGQIEQSWHKYHGWRMRQSSSMSAKWNRRQRSRARAKMQKLSRRINWGLVK